MSNLKKQAPYGAFFVLLVVLCVFFYLLSGVCNIPNVNILNLEDSIIYSFTHPLEAWNDKTPAFMGVGLIIWFWLIALYMIYNRNYHKDMYGSSTWRDVHEANDFYADKDDKYNRIISQNLKVSLRQGLANNNAIICATSGDFKTTAWVEQNILRFLSAYIILDVKGELQRKWGNAFKRAGYKILSLNFQNPNKSNRYNPFVYIENENDVLRMVKILFDACRPMKQNYAASADPFWDDAVKLVFHSGISAVWLEGKKSKKHGTMNRLMELYKMESQKVYFETTDEVKSKLQLYMDDLAEKYGDDYPPVRDYRKLKDGAPDTVRSVFLMVYAMLEIFEIAEVKRIFEGNDFDIRELGLGVDGDPNKKTVVFLELPPLNNAYDVVINMFYTQCFDILERTADMEREDGTLPVRVEFIMDEFYTGPKPLDVPRLLGIVRGWNISMVLILQDFAQLEDLYPGKKFEIVLNNVSVVVFMGSGPMVTSGQKIVSETIGKGTFDIQTDNMHLGSNGHAALNWQQGGRELMLPDEVKNLPPTDLIVFIKSSKPIIDTKAIPFDYPAYDYKSPKWLKKPYQEMRALGNYEHPIYTLYDEEHFHYITIDREEAMQIVTDKKDIEALQYAANNDESIYTFNVDEDELLYLSWGSKEYTQENVEAIYKQAMEDAEFRKEKLNGLIVLQDVEGSTVPNFSTNKITDKSAWDTTSSLKRLISDHWDDLSTLEQEEIYLAIDEGLNEEQLRRLILCSLVEMPILRRAFALENQGKG